MAVAVEMGEDRHARLALHAATSLAAARHDDVELPSGPAGSRRPRRGRVGTSWIASPGRPAASRPSRIAAAIGRGAEGIRAAAQDRGIAALQAQRAGIGRHVGAALEDHGDDAERRRDTLEAQAVRPRPFRQHAAERIGQVGDRGDGVRNAARRFSSRASRSMKAALKPAALPSARSCALAARILAWARSAGHGERRMRCSARLSATLRAAVRAAA
jgi:hypothetical protein